MSIRVDWKKFFLVFVISYKPKQQQIKMVSHDEGLCPEMALVSQYVLILEKPINNFKKSIY